MKTNLSSLIPFKIAYITKLKRELIDREVKKFDLSRTQWQALAWINILGTPCTQQALLKSLELDRGQLARILDQLDKKGIITRTQLPNDRRSLEINLTKSGHTLLAKLEQVMQYESNIMSKGLSNEDKKTLDRLMDKLTDNILSELNSQAEE